MCSNRINSTAKPMVLSFLGGKGWRAVWWGVCPATALHIAADLALGKSGFTLTGGGHPPLGGLLPLWLR